MLINCKLLGLIISLQEFNNISCDHDSVVCLVVSPPTPPQPRPSLLPQLVRVRPSLSRGETKGERSDRLGIREREGSIHREGSRHIQNQWIILGVCIKQQASH